MRRLAVLIAALSVVAAACSGAPSTDTFGEDLYNVSCGRCHGPNLEGGIGPAVDAGSRTALEFSDAQIADIIRVGPGAMPGFDRLSDEQVDSLVEFLRSRHGSQ